MSNETAIDRHLLDPDEDFLANLDMDFESDVVIDGISCLDSISRQSQGSCFTEGWKS